MFLQALKNAYEMCVCVCERERERERGGERERERERGGAAVENLKKWLEDSSYTYPIIPSEAFLWAFESEHPAISKSLKVILPGKGSHAVYTDRQV
jgi:hypothetical protein